MHFCTKYQLLYFKEDLKQQTHKHQGDKYLVQCQNKVYRKAQIFKSQNHATTVKKVT